MKKIHFLAAIVIMLPSVQAQHIDLSKYDELSVEQKAEFFGGASKSRLQNESDFLKALILGSQDTNEAVRRLTVQRAAMTMRGLQQLAQTGAPAPIESTDLKTLQELMKRLINDPDRETRSSAVRALVAAQSPTQTTEALLLDYLQGERDEELRANLIESMMDAGYQSAPFKREIVNRIAQADGKELEALAAAAAKLHLVEALPALIECIGTPDVPQVILLRSVGGFGRIAGGAKAKLEAILADPSSINHSEARAALMALAQEPSPSQPVNAFVDLIVRYDSQKKPPVHDDKSKSSDGAGSNRTEDAPNQMPKLPVDSWQSSTRWVVMVVIVAALGVLWLMLKPRS